MSSVWSPRRCDHTAGSARRATLYATPVSGAFSVFNATSGAVDVRHDSVACMRSVACKGQVSQLASCCCCYHVSAVQVTWQLATLLALHSVAQTARMAAHPKLAPTFSYLDMRILRSSHAVSACEVYPATF
jgi:hypothetical protein